MYKSGFPDRIRQNRLGRLRHTNRNAGLWKQWRAHMSPSPRELARVEILCKIDDFPIKRKCFWRQLLLPTNHVANGKQKMLTSIYMQNHWKFKPMQERSFPNFKNIAVASSFDFSTFCTLATTLDCRFVYYSKWSHETWRIHTCPRRIKDIFYLHRRRDLHHRCQFKFQVIDDFPPPSPSLYTMTSENTKYTPISHFA